MYLVIDIGGTKTLLAIFSSHGRLLETSRFETPKEYPQFLKALATDFAALKHNPDKLVSCTVGAPALIDRSNGHGMAFGNRPWENVPLKADIRKITHLPTVIENDSNLAGLSEAILIGHKYKKVLYVTISTGIGGTVIINGKLDPDYLDVEFGQMMFEHDGKLQRWEEFASGKAIFAKYGKKASQIKDDSDWYVIARNIAIGLTNVVVNTTPQVVIIGGGVGSHFEKFADELHETMMLYESNLVSVPPIRKAIRAEEAVIYGCYELARQLKD